MQYVLSEEEYGKLSQMAKIGKESLEVNKLQELCTLAANHVPSDWNNVNIPWGCILTNNRLEYCDSRI